MYDRIISLDFELYNTKHYWSVCWAGVCLADGNFDLVSAFDVIINPGIDEKFAGPDMKFPFKLKDLKKRDTFGGYSDKILGLISKNTLVLGHAFENDLRMIIDVCHKFNLLLPSFDFLDTNVLYNAVSGETNEHSLVSLGEKYGVEFSAHDPKEDARATLAVTKGCIGGKSLEDFLQEYKITVGKLENGVVRKCYYDGMSEGRKQKINNHNAVFDTVMRLGQGKGTKYFIDNAITSEQNAVALAEKILLSGGQIVSSSYSADIVITNNLSLKADPKYISLKSALDRFSISYDGFDFTPNKIRDEKNHPISLTDYYKSAYKSYEGSGRLDGKGVAFSKGVERRRDFEELIIGVIQSGGSVCPRVDLSDYFVVENKSDIKKNFSDGRIKAYLHGRKACLIQVDELKEIIKKN